MRWDALFADLEARLEAESVADFEAEVAELARAAVGQVTLAQRLRAQVGGGVVLRLVRGAIVRATVRGVGHDVVLLSDEAGRSVLVPLTSIAVVSGLGRAAVEASSPVLARVGLRQALRDLARSREPVRCLVAGGELAGTVDRVGADHLDVGRRRVDDIASPGPDTIALAALDAVWSD